MSKDDAPVFKLSEFVVNPIKYAYKSSHTIKHKAR